MNFDYLFLADAHLEPCRGCFLCLSKGEDCCPLQDDREEIERGCFIPTESSSVTLVYAMNVTALMKNFLDRFAYTLHRPRFFQQRAMIVSTTGALGLKEAMDRMAVIRFSGFDLVQRAGFVTPNNPVSTRSKERIDRSITEAAEKFCTPLNSGLTTSPGLINLIAFRSQQAAFGLVGEYGLGEADYSYFQERGWLDKKRRYFTDVEVNPLKNLIAVAIGRKVRRDIYERSARCPLVTAGIMNLHAFGKDQDR